MKKLITVILILAVSLSLASCGGSAQDKMQTLVKGNMDSIYLGKATSEYLNIVDLTPEAAKEEYLAGLEAEAEFFCLYFGIIDTNYNETYAEDVPDEIKQKIVDMYKEIYSHSAYKVGSSRTNGDNYDVDLTIEPIDIMEKAIQKIDVEGYEPYDEFLSKYENLDMDSMSEEEINALLVEYNTDYATVIIDLITGLIPEIGFKEAKEMTVRIEPDTDGIYVINEEDWKAIDDYIIYYP